MKKHILFLSLILLSCGESKVPEAEAVKEDESNEHTVDEFQAILDSAGVKGSILVLEDGVTYYSNDFEWARQGRLPASTFKIPNSMIALELGIIEDDSTVIEWDGKPRFQKRWEQDMSFRDAFHTSCVPCFQEIARKIGVKHMKNYLYDLNYGKMVVDSANIDMFWLEGDSRISQFGQVSFLRTFNEVRLPISRRTFTIMHRMMVIEENEKYTIRGKTGWSQQNGIDNCWYVGYVETNHGYYYFATNIEAGQETVIDSLPAIRRSVTDRALELMGVFE